MTLRLHVLTLAWVSTLSAPAAALPEPERGDLEERLRQVRAEEERLERLWDEIGQGRPIAPEDAVARLSKTTAHRPALPAASEVDLPNESELAFERARLESVRARLSRVNRSTRPTQSAPVEQPPATQPVVLHKPQPEAEPRALDESVAAEQAPAEEPAEPIAATPADPMRLADALMAQGDLPAALTAYGIASSAAEERGELVQVARARYGAARALERTGQTEEALLAYAAVHDLPEAGEWARAARFARRFIEWRRQVSVSGLKEEQQ